MIHYEALEIRLIRQPLPAPYMRNRKPTHNRPPSDVPFVNPFASTSEASDPSIIICTTIAQLCLLTDELSDPGLNDRFISKYTQLRFSRLSIEWLIPMVYASNTNMRRGWIIADLNM